MLCTLLDVLCALFCKSCQARLHKYVDVVTIAFAITIMRVVYCSRYLDRTRKHKLFLHLNTLCIFLHLDESPGIVSVFGIFPSSKFLTMLAHT